MNNPQESVLYYIHDPMCSWCWGFVLTWKAIQDGLPSNVMVDYVAGGLAPDDDQPMPQQQRIAIARALVGKPDLILVDEPTGNLDSKNGDQVMALLATLNKSGSTIVMVTHDSRYSRSASRQIQLLDGKIISESIVNHNSEKNNELNTAESLQGAA